MGTFLQYQLSKSYALQIFLFEGQFDWLAHDWFLFGRSDMSKHGVFQTLFKIDSEERVKNKHFFKEINAIWGTSWVLVFQSGSRSELKLLQIF